jgi:hypothetical protein
VWLPRACGQIARAWVVPLPIDAHTGLPLSAYAGAAKAIEAAAMLVTTVLRIMQSIAAGRKSQLAEKGESWTGRPHFLTDS